MRNQLKSIETSLLSFEQAEPEVELRAVGKQLAASIALIDLKFVSEVNVDHWKSLLDNFNIPELSQVVQTIKNKLIQKKLEEDSRRQLSNESIMNSKRMIIESHSTLQTAQSNQKEERTSVAEGPVQSQFNFFSQRENFSQGCIPGKYPASNKSVIEQSQMTNETLLAAKETVGLSRAEHFLKTFIKSNQVKKEIPSDLKSQKQSSKATSNASVIHLKAIKNKENQGVLGQKNYRRVLSNGISTRLVAKPLALKTASSQHFGKFWASNSRDSIQAFNEQQSDTQGFLMNIMNFEEFDPYPCPDSPNHESTQSGNRWLANRVPPKKIDMPSPAKSIHSEIKESHLSANIGFLRQEKTPEKLLPAGLFKNSTNLTKDRSLIKAISKSKHSLGKDSCRKVSAAKISGLKLQRAASAVCGQHQQRGPMQWDTEIVAFGTPVKEECPYMESDGRFRF